MSDEPDDPLLSVARNLRAIVDLSETLRDQAASRSMHREMPGGDATVMLGPVASPEAWENRVETIERLWWEDDERDKDDRPSIGSDEDAGWEPPLQTLLFWSEAWRYEHGVMLDARPTVEGEAAWLGELVEWAFEHEPHFDDFAADMAAARRRLEAVLYAGIREERTRIPCIDCDTSRDGQDLRILLVTHYAGDKPNFVCPDCKRKGPEDHWFCPRCRRQYDESSLRLAEHHDLERQTGTEWQPVDVAAGALEVPLWEVKRIATACDIASRSLLVLWPEARKIHRRRHLAVPETTAV